MAHEIGILMFLLLVAFLGGFCQGNNEEVTQCIDGPSHKDKPSPEGPGYVDCLSWKDKACCTANFTAELKRNNVEVMYNFSWNHCKNLSKVCERFIKNEECFWQCEPNLIKWHTGDGKLKSVPICANYCNNWFDACKTDFTCAEDWLAGFNYSNSVYSCPISSTCRSFSEVFKDGKDLCNTMWGKSFYYETSKNCMVMQFSGDNPNNAVSVTLSPPTSSASCYSKFIYPMLVLTLLMLNVLEFV